MAGVSSLKKKKIVVMMGGPSSEHDVSRASGEMVYKALVGRPELEVKSLTLGRDGKWTLSDSPPAVLPRPYERVSMVPRQHTIQGIQLLEDVDAAFLAFHGTFGEDGTMQGLMETLGVPYTGSGPLASALAMDKAKAKELFGLYGLRVPQQVLLTAMRFAGDMDRAVKEVEDHLAYPVVVKPNVGGSSVGVSMVQDGSVLRTALGESLTHGVDVLVEAKLVGREVTCAVLENLDGTLRALPVIEIIARRGGFFDFASKYETGGSDEICPARLSVEDTHAVQAAAIRAHQALGCEGFSRTDMFLTENGPVVLELNTIPGMTPNSLLPKAAQVAGIPFDALMGHLIENAIARFERRRVI